jgi:hypothetical protein
MSSTSLILASPRRAVWLGRVFVPSFSDLFLIFFVFWSFLASPQGWQGLLRDADTGFHIRVGEWIMRTTSVPIHDLFAFARPGAHWYAFEWLSEVIFAALNGWAGLKGVVFFSGIVLAITFTIVLRHSIRRGANALLTVFLVLLAVSAASIHFHARPHIFTMLFLAAGMWILDSDRKARSRLVWTLPLLTALWANLHAGFSLLLVLLGLLVVGSLLERRRDCARRYTLLLLLCGCGSLLNPYGVRLPWHVFDLVFSRSRLSLVDEFKAPDFRSESHLAYMVLLFVALAVVVPLLRKRNITDVLVILFLGYCSLTAARHIPLFVIVSVPIIAAEWTMLLNEWRASRQILDSFGFSRAKFEHTSVWPAAFVCILPIIGGITWPSDFDKTEFPVAIAATAQQHIVASRLFTTDQWANYLIFKNPQQRVFIDSQHQIYGEVVLSDALGMMSGRHDWRELLDKYTIQAALCPVDAPLTSLLERDSGWTQIAKTPLAILFSRNRYP